MSRTRFLLVIIAVFCGSFMGGMLANLANIGPSHAQEGTKIPKGYLWQRLADRELSFLQFDADSYLTPLPEPVGVQFGQGAIGELWTNQLTALVEVSTRRVVVMGVDMRLFSENILSTLVRKGIFTKAEAIEILKNSKAEIGKPKPYFE